MEYIPNPHPWLARKSAMSGSFASILATGEDIHSNLPAEDFNPSASDNINDSIVMYSKKLMHCVRVLIAYYWMGVADLRGSVHTSDDVGRQFVSQCGGRR